jgi:hypothetical protein
MLCFASTDKSNRSTDISLVLKPAPMGQFKNLQWNLEFSSRSIADKVPQDLNFTQINQVEHGTYT